MQKKENQEPWLKKIFSAKRVKAFPAYFSNKIRFYSFLLALPYTWCVCFFLIPALIICKISLAQCSWSLPPFTPLMCEIDRYFFYINIYLGNFIALFTDSFYFSAALTSLLLAGATTLLCLVIGYGMAYAISRMPKRLHITLVLLVVLPFASSFLIRVYAWMGLLSSQGVLNTLLSYIGLTHHPIHFLDNGWIVCLVMVYCYLPFMILPIYAVLEKIDPLYIEASLDLGANYWNSFWQITVPLSLPGVFAGCTLVFVPSLGEFVIPELLGGSQMMTIGQSIWNEFFANRDWPLACAIAVFMMLSFSFYFLLSRIKKSFIGKQKS
jgi:putrescine transport system permease protein